jgi:hypothetical protein
MSSSSANYGCRVVLRRNWQSEGYNMAEVVVEGDELVVRLRPMDRGAQ